MPAAAATTTTATSPHQSLNGFACCAFLFSSSSRTFLCRLRFSSHLPRRTIPTKCMMRAMPFVMHGGTRQPGPADARAGDPKAGWPAGQLGRRSGGRAGGRAGPAEHPFMHAPVHLFMHLFIDLSLRPSIGYAGLTTATLFPLLPEQADGAVSRLGKKATGPSGGVRMGRSVAGEGDGSGDPGDPRC